MKLAAFDIETWGAKPGYALQPWRAQTNEAGIICYSIFNGESLLSDFSLPEYLYCGWNLKFDLAFLLNKSNILTGDLFNARYLDGMLLLKRLGYKLDTYALKPTLERFADKIDFGKYKYEIGYNEKIKFKVGALNETYSQEDIVEIKKYNVKDAVYTYYLIKYLIKEATPQVLKQAIRESTVSVFFADIWNRGILIDEIAINDYGTTVDSTLENILNVLSKVGLTKDVINSPKQLREYLTAKFNVKLFKRTAKGEYSVDIAVIKNLYYKTEGILKKILKTLIKYKELNTEHVKFIETARECLKENAYIHSEPILNSTYTGRLTYSSTQRIDELKKFKNGKEKIVKKEIKLGLAMHQIKREGEIRKIFKAPDGYQLAELDFSGQEMRLIAAIAKEPTMIEFFNENKDLHAYTGASILEMFYEEFMELKRTNPDIYRSARYIGKQTNLSLQYRQSAQAMYKTWHDKHNILDKSLEEAYQARETYLRIYGGIPKYWKEMEMFVKENFYTVNMAGRKHYLKDWSPDKQWSNVQTAINFPIQSTGAEQKVLALFCLRNFIKEHHIQFAWDLHDGLYFYVPDCMMITELVQEMAQIMSHLPYEKAWGWQPAVEFPVEAKIGYTWGDLKSINWED